MLQIIIIVLAVAADQLTKFFLLPPVQGQTVVVIPGVFNLTNVSNTGASFGMFQGAQVFFIIITIIILAVGIVMMIKTRKRQSVFLKICLSVVTAGAIGNFIDRVSFGHVRDLFDFHQLYFPWVFNVADACLVIGAILLGIYVIFFYRPKKQGAGENDGKTPTEE
jgi:signal peptidase II